MNKHLKELYSPSIDGIELPLVKTKIFSLEEKKAEMELLLTGNKPLSISLGLSAGQLKLEWNVCDLKAYFHTIVNKSLLKAICDKLQGEEVNIKELNIEEDEYTNSSTKCVEYLQRRLKKSNRSRYSSRNLITGNEASYTLYASARNTLAADTRIK